MCDHCFNASDFQLPSGVRICQDCFYESYCVCCWEPTTQVGPTSEDSFCATCINNNLPQERMQHHIVAPINDINTIIYNINPINNAMDETEDEEYDGTFDLPLFDQYILQNNYEEEEPWPIAPIETDDETDDETPDDLYGPPQGFDMNMASVVEHRPDYMDNLINAQVHYEGKWYFALGGQIYSVPYEIEIDDDHVRRDLVENWDDVLWVGSIFGEYIAWY
jgi:hypothetical protein